MSVSLRQRSPRDPLPPKTAAPRAKYNRRRQTVRQNEDRRSHSRPKQSLSKPLQEPCLLGNAEVYTLISPVASPLTPISSDLMKREQVEIRKSSPCTLTNCPLVYHHFLLPYADSIVKKIIRLWDCLRLPFQEQRYAMRSLIANESLLVPYFTRLKTLNTLVRAYNHCCKIRARVLERFRSGLYGSISRDGVILNILQLRELTIFMVSLDNKANILLDRPISLTELSYRGKFSLEAPFFDECLFTEEVVTTVLLETEFIRTMNLIQLQTLINIFFDRCVSWYIPADSPRDKFADYEQKARKIVSLYFLLGLVADAPFEGNILPALFIAHLISIKNSDIAVFRNELLSLCSDVDSSSIFTGENSSTYISTPLQPLFGLTDYTSDVPSSSQQICAEHRHSSHHSSVQKPAGEDILLTPSETFHAILTNGLLEEINEEVILFSRNLGYNLPVIPVEPSGDTIEIYRIVHSGYSINSLNNGQDNSLTSVSVPSPAGVESIWIHKPNYTEFSISNACDRSIEGVTGLDPIQLLGEEDYDLLGILNWPRINVTPFLVEGASKLMKRLIANNIERRSRSLPARHPQHARTQRKGVLYNTKDASDQQNAQPPPPPLVHTEATPPGFSKSVPLRPKFIRKVVIGSTLKDPHDIRAQYIAKPELTLEDLEHEPVSSANLFEIENKEHQYSSELDTYDQPIENTEIIVSTDLTAIFLGNNSQPDESPLSSNSTI